MASEQDEVASLDRVLTRLALTEDDKLEKVLHKLLPMVIDTLKSPHAKTRAKIMEILSHINKRVKSQRHIPLPLQPLVTLALQPSPVPMVRNFALVYAELAFERAPPQQQLEVVPLLWEGISAKNLQHQAILLRMATAGLGALQPPSSSTYGAVSIPGFGSGGSSSTINGAKLLPSAEADRQLVMLHMLKILLYQRPSSGFTKPLTPLAAATADQADAAAAATAAPLPPGLSAADVKDIETKGVPDLETLNKTKMGILNLIAGAAEGMPGVSSTNNSSSKAGDDATASDAAASATSGANGGTASQTSMLLPAQQLLLPLLVASCDPNEAVARRGDELLKKICNPDSPKPGVDLEDEQTVHRLMVLLLGTKEVDPVNPKATSSAVAPDHATAPASSALSQRIMSLLVKSVAAANALPATAKVMNYCLYGPNATARLRNLGMEFTVWVFKHAAVWQLRTLAPVVMKRLMGELGGDTEAGDAMQVDAGSSATAVAMRGFVYQAVAQLSQRLPSYFQGDTRVARQFFSALASEPPGARAGVQEAVAMLATAYAGGNGTAEQSHELEMLLLDSSSSPQDAVRMCAVQWAVKLFPLSHIISRYICVIAAGDLKLEVREAALKGLNLHPSQTQGLGSKAGTEQPPQYPTVDAMLAFVRDRHPRFADVADLNRSLQLPARSFQALISFLAACKQAAAKPLNQSSTKPSPKPLTAANRTQDAAEVLPDAAAALTPPATATAAATATSASGQQQQQLPWDAYVLLLEHALCRESPRDLIVAALQALVDEAGGVGCADSETTATAALAGGDAATARPGAYSAALEERYASRLTWLRSFLSQPDPDARVAAARLIGIATSALSQTDAAGLLSQLLASFVPAADGKVPVVSSSRLEEAEGNLVAAGFVAAQCCSGRPGLPDATLSHVVHTLYNTLNHKSVMMAAAAALSLGHMGLRGPLPAVAVADGSSSSDAAAAATSTNGAASSGAPAPSKKSDDATAVVTRVISLVSHRDAAVACQAVAAAGYLCYGDDSSGVLQPIAKALLAIATTNKSEEVTLAAGESLALVFGGCHVSADVITRSNFKSLGASLAEGVLALDLSAGSQSGTQLTSAAGVGRGASEADAATAMQVDSQQGATADATTATDMEVEESGGGKRARFSSSRENIQEYVLSELMTNLAVASRSETRSAAAVWLVSLLSYCQDVPLLQQQLTELQSSFLGLLGDSNDLTQEMASRGVSLLYRLGTPAVQQQLLASLVSVLQGNVAGMLVGGGKSAAGMANRGVTGDTRVFEEGQLGAAPGGGSLSTYRELCALATDLGQPDLIYKFMELAKHNTALNTKKGAAVGVAGIARLISQGTGGSSSSGGLGAVLGEGKLAALLPRLYRYQYDPNPRVSESMSAIWTALVDDTKKTLDTHFDAIISELLKDMGGRLWRKRQAGCSALSDLLQGRRWAQVGPHITQVWVMTLRAMDDVKESVRGAAGGLCRTVRALTLRLVDTQQTPAADARACVAAVLPLLLDQGIGSSVAEVRAVALDTITNTVKNAGAQQVRPVLPQLVSVLLEALSGLEDVRLNYVEQHAERLGFDSDRLDAVRVSASRSSPVADTLDLAAKYMDEASLGEVVTVLTGVVRRGVGLNTKVGTARFVRNLTQRLGTWGLGSQTGPLLKPLVSAVANERSMVVRKAYAAAAAAVVAKASSKRQEKFVGDAIEMYGAVGGEGIEGGNPDNMRLAGGLLLGELLRASPDVFQQFATQILPVAFCAHFDGDADVAASWRLIWEEGAPSAGAAVRLYCKEMTAFVLEGVKGGKTWGRKKACAEALITMCELGGDALNPYAQDLCKTLLPEVSAGRLWDGKESLVQALGVLCSACPRVLCCETDQFNPILDALLAAVVRKKRSYRAAALESLEKLCATLYKLSQQQNFGQQQQQNLGLVTDGVYSKVSQPLLDSCQEHATAGKKTPGPKPSNDQADATANDATASEQPQPLSLPESIRCLAAAWKLIDAGSARQTGAELAASLALVMTTPGQPWTAWSAAVAAAQELLQHALALKLDQDDYVPWLVPLTGGLVNCIASSTVSQLRSGAIAALTDILKATDGGILIKEQQQQQQQHTTEGTGTAAANGSSAPATAVASQQGLLSSVRSTLQGVVDTEPSAALKAAAATALALVVIMDTQ